MQHTQHTHNKRHDTDASNNKQEQQTHNDLVPRLHNEFEAAICSGGHIFLGPSFLFFLLLCYHHLPRHRSHRGLMGIECNLCWFLGCRYLRVQGLLGGYLHRLCWEKNHQSHTLPSIFQANWGNFWQPNFQSLGKVCLEPASQLTCSSSPPFIHPLKAASEPRCTQAPTQNYPLSDFC